MITVAKKTKLSPTMIIRLIREEWKREPRGREKEKLHVISYAPERNFR
jgi:hypothetical protein